MKVFARRTGIYQDIEVYRERIDGIGCLVEGYYSVCRLLAGVLYLFGCMLYHPCLFLLREIGRMQK